jgi:chitinase
MDSESLLFVFKECFTVKKRLFLITPVLFASGLWFTCANPSEFKVSSYIRTWALPYEEQKNSPYWNADMIKGQYLTDLIIAFAVIDRTDGTSIYIPELRGPQRFSNIWNEVAAIKKKYPKLRVNISIGGWGADGFSDMADDTGMRAVFVTNVCEWLEKYNLDGVDIDWEYPVGPPWGQEIKSRSADRANYISLLKDLRTAMDTLGKKTKKHYVLSTAVPASSWFVKANDVVSASKIVDNLKLMTYDYYGEWSNTTGHNSNLYKNPQDPDGWSTEQAVNVYLAAGVPPEKIMLGVAFYGRAFKGVESGANNGLFQPFKSPAFEDGSADWAKINEFLKEGSGYTRYWDDKAKAPYLYNGDIWITYTDEEQIKLLTQYAKEKKLSGVFNWEYGHDMGAELLKVLSEEAK